ncbi:MAG: class I SAM-dependent methyltransferase [Cytophagales bacterium]
MVTKTWFASWFDSEYYHILYKNRDDSEARTFILNLVNKFRIESKNKVLDLACGKGRHSIFLNSLGMDVTGVDLSENSIQFAKQFENERLKFEVHDMREPFAKNSFDFVLNLFTSFGYFENDEDNLKTILAVVQNMKADGIFLIDFFNAHKILANLVSSEIKTIDGIAFEIHKRIENGYIFKQIAFSDQGKDYSFTEKVQYFSRSDFEILFEKAGLEIVDCFGNYNLESFDEHNSERLILACKKLSINKI